MKIAYITGLGRSGSTLLDLILAAHSQAFSVGEVKTLSRYTAASASERNDNPRQSCTCGADSVWVCPVWSQVEAHLQAEHGVSLRDLRIKADDEERFRTDNLRLLHAIAAATGASLLVDSSKGLTRLKRLQAIPGLDVHPIHVVRDPKGRANSVRKRRNWVAGPAVDYNYSALRHWAYLRGREHSLVRYEELAADPRGVVGALMARLGLGLEEQQLSQWAEMEQHNLSGNGMRRSGSDSTITPDTAYRRDLPAAKRWAIDAVTWPGKLFTRLEERALGAQ
jgi:hypothetical protein